MCAFVRDLTERKKAEQEHLRLQNLESLGVLAGGIAHDFNNILSTILGRASIAADEIPDGSAKDDLIAIEKATKRAVSLTQQLLTFARGGTPQKSIIDLDKIIQDTTNFSLSGSNIAHKFSFSDTFKVDADPGQIAQVIQNLVINAKQAMPSGGIITITTKDHYDLSQKVFVEITIEDQGIGISQDHLNNIFNPYFTTKQTGSGLGLSVCHSIITKHMGQISVQSELGKGTKFIILLPAVIHDSRKSYDTNKKVSESLNVLIMDDEADIRDLLRNLLSRSGHKVTESKDGREAIQLFKKAKENGEIFDLIFMDLTVKGGLGGKEAIKELREFDPEVKVIVSSGYADSSIAKYKEDGFNGMLNKPYSRKDLDSAIYSVFNE
jgi:CheY-like chemotaxis protein